MYDNPTARSRPELSEFFEEARDAEKHYVSQKIFPQRSVETVTGRFPVIKVGSGNLLNKDSLKRSPGAEYAKTDRTFEWDTYSCQDEGLEEPIDDSFAASMEEYFDAEVLSGKLVSRQVALAHELEGASLAFNPSLFTATDAAVEYTEANIDTFDFAQDVMKAQNRFSDSVQEANILVLSDTLWTLVRRSKKLVSYLFPATGAGETRLVTRKMVAEAFELSDVIIAKSVVNVALKGKTPVIARVWSDAYIGLYNAQGGDFSAGGVGRTLTWKADCPGGLFTTETYRDESKRSNVVRVRKHSTQKVLDKSAGQLITTGAE